VGIVGGAGFMGRLHSLAYGSVRAIYGDGLPRVERRRLADVRIGPAQVAAARYGWAEATDDWRDITRADDIDLVDIVTPNDAHAEIAIDAARHGKHVLCEKPLAGDAETAAAMAMAAAASGGVHQVGFVFRAWPAMALAKQYILEGRLGRALYFRGHFFHDYALDPMLPFSWRFRRDVAGAGALGDIGSHVLDLARYLMGDVERVLGRSMTFLGERPRPEGGVARVDVDDATDLLLEFTGGARGSVQVNWSAAGYKTDLGFEVWGDRGSVRFSWQQPNELLFYSCADEPDSRGYRTVILGPEHVRAEAFWPTPGLGLGYADAFAISVSDLLTAIRDRRPAAPGFADGLRVAEVIEAALASVRRRGWVDVARRDLGEASLDTR
jgi:predicted dehydrogenase